MTDSDVEWLNGISTNDATRVTFRRTGRRVSPLAMLLLWINSAHAGGPTLSFDIPAGEATKTVSQFLRESKVESPFLIDDLRGIHTNAVVGSFEVSEALRHLLEGTGLEYSFERNYSFVTIAPARKQVPQTSPARERADAPLQGVIVSAAEPVQISSNGLPPLKTIDGREIERMGWNLESAFAALFLTNIAHLSGGQPNTVDLGANPIDLRGLGANETLILVNSRRVGTLWTGGTRGEGEVLRAIPTSAVDRIEIYPATVANRYGGGATAGVVNIILRQDCAGARYGASFRDSSRRDSANRRLFVSDCLLGFNDRTQVSFSASEGKESSLQSQSRGLLARGRALIQLNNESFFQNSGIPPIGAQTNVYFVGDSGAIQPGSYLTVPKGYTREQGLGPLLANLGHYNLDPANSAQPDGGAGSVIRNGPRTRYVSANVLQQFSDRITGHAEFSRYELEVRNPTSIAPYTGLTGLYLPADAPGNVFGQAVYVSVPAVGGDGSLQTRADSKQLVVGLNLLPMDSWKGSLEYSRTQRMQEWNLSVGRSAVPAVLNGELEVFRDLSTGGLDLDSLKDTLFTPGLVSTTDALTLQAEGTVGAVTLQGLLEHRNQRFEGGMEYLRTGSADATPASFLPRQFRTIDSAYVELRAPMGGVTNSPSGKEPRFELQLAARFDEYATLVSPPRVAASSTTAIESQPSRFRKLTPTVGFQFRPFSQLAFRSSFGKGFVPPSGDQLAPPVPRRFQQGAFHDPQRGNEPTDVVDLQAGGNPALQPEHSQSWSAGLLLRPARERGLQGSLDYVVITKTDDIVNPADLLMTDFALFARRYPERVTRASVATDDPFGVGRITAIDATHINIARSRVRAWDLDVSYGTEPNRLGQLDLLGHVTWQPEFSNRPAPDAPTVNYAGVTANAPLKLGAVGEVTFTRGRGKFSWVTRYLGPYQVSRDAVTIRNQGGRMVRHQTYHDMAFTYELPHGIPLNFSVQNVFDRPPPFDSGSLNYFSPFGDPRGAMYGVSVSGRF